MFAGVPWSDYLHNMARDGTYGDEITLQAIADCYSITISVVSTLAPDNPKQWKYKRRTVSRAF